MERKALKQMAQMVLEQRQPPAGAAPPKSRHTMHTLHRMRR